MKRWLALVTAVAFGCGDSGSGANLDGGHDGDGGDNGGDGGTLGTRTVMLTLTNRPTNPQKFSFLVAYQDGAGAWQLAPAPTGDVYTFQVNAPSYGVAYACIGATPSTMGTSTTRSVTTAHFAVSERTSVTLEVPARCSDRMPDGVMLSGNVSNRPLGGALVVQYAGRTAFVGGQSGNFSLNVPTGSHDLVVSHVVAEGNGDFYVDEVLVQRDVNITANATRSIDFALSEGTTFHDVDTSDAPFNARVVATTTLSTANGTTAQLTREAQSHESDALADSQQRTSDIYEQAITVTQFGSSASISHFTSAPGDQTYAAPAPLGAVMTTVPTKMPYVTVQTTWTAYPEAVGYLWTASQLNSCSGQAQCTTTWSGYVSPGVVGQNPGYRMPDLSGLTGWVEAYELTSNTIAGSVTAMKSSAGVADFPSGAPADGVDRVLVRQDYAAQP